MKKYLTVILIATLPLVYSGILAGAPLDGLTLEVSRNAEQELLRERIQEQAKLEIRKSTIKLNIPIEEHLGLYSDVVYISPAEEIAHLTREEDTGPIGLFPAVVLIATLDNVVRASLYVLKLLI